MTRPRTLALACLLPLSLLAAACGDDDDTAAVTDDAASEAVPASDDAVSDEAAPSDEAATSADVSSDEAATSDEVLTSDEAATSDEVVSSGEGVCADAEAVDRLVTEFNSSPESTPDRQYFEDLQVVVEQLQGVDNGDLAAQLDVLHTAMDDLGDIAEEAGGDEEAANELLLGYDNTDLTTAVLDFLEYASTECGIGDSIGADPSDVLADIEVGDPADPIETDDPAFEALIQGCYGGDGAACDELYFTTPVDSPEEAYGASCGGRTQQPVPGSCEQLLAAG